MAYINKKKIFFAGISKGISERYTEGVIVEDIEPEVSLISFTIAGTSYIAEEGMTWGEWVASDYNTDGYKAHANLGSGTEDSKVPAKNHYCITYNSTMVSFGDLIIADASYGLEYNTGAGGAG